MSPIDAREGFRANAELIDDARGFGIDDELDRAADDDPVEALPLK